MANLASLLKDLNIANMEQRLARLNSTMLLRIQSVAFLQTFIGELRVLTSK